MSTSGGSGGCGGCGNLFRTGEDYRNHLPCPGSIEDLKTRGESNAEFFAREKAKTGGLKYDDGKAPWHLAPWDAFLAIVLILAFGAKKYAARNWEKGISYSRLYSALLRHITAWWNGEDLDPETGHSHVAHAACCVCFLLAFVLRGRGDLDDRPHNVTSTHYEAELR